MNSYCEKDCCTQGNVNFVYGDKYICKYVCTNYELHVVGSICFCEQIDVCLGSPNPCKLLELAISPPCSSPLPSSAGKQAGFPAEWALFWEDLWLTASVPSNSANRAVKRGDVQKDRGETGKSSRSKEKTKV